MPEITNFKPGMDYKYAILVRPSLMARWTSLPIWAAMRTVFPILIGLILSGIYAVDSTLIQLEKMIPFWIVQSVLAALHCYFLVRTLAKEVG